MRSQTSYLVVMMAMMAVFAIFRLEHRALVLLPGNLAVALSLAIGAAVVAMRRPFSYPVGLFAAALTAGVGLAALTGGESTFRYVRLPGYPLIWVVIGLYVAFRLVINRQYEQRQRAAAPRQTPTDEA